MSDEKKLTDKEMDCLHDIYTSDCEECHVFDEACPLFDEGCNKILPKAIKKLIHRLQDENKTLKTELRKECEEHEEFTKQAKEEIERLTEENGYLKQCADNFLADYQKAQKQVDELKEERDVFKNLFEHCNNSSITIDQIIESMNSFYREQAEHLAELKIEQAVKDTAKEIFEKIFGVLFCFTTQGKSEEYNEGFIQCLSEIDERIQKLAKEHGVEVE